MTNFSTTATTLWEMLSYARPHNSQTELKFIKSFILPLGAVTDGYNNYYVKIGDNPTILWSCHTDTMHANEGMQLLELKQGFITIAKKKAGRCLGADDGAGVWLLSEMIRANISGLYVFHRGEERGGLGSKWIANNNPQFLNGIEHAIAVDRRGYKSVITHQMYGRCCSEDFAKAMSERLTNEKRWLSYEPDDGGTFTDTANYMDLVPECTNISVGYDREHGPTESLDLQHILELRDHLCETDFSGLPVVRDPHEIDEEDLEYSTWLPGRDYKYEYKYGNSMRYNLRGSIYKNLEDWIREYPDVAAQILEEFGIDETEFEKVVTDLYG